MTDDIHLATLCRNRHAPIEIRAETRPKLLKKFLEKANTEILVEIKGLPCDHLFCKACFEGLDQSHDTVKCSKCLKVFPSGSTGRDIPFFTILNKIFLKALESQKLQESANSVEMSGARGLKRPQPSNNPALEPSNTKRCRGRQKMPDETSTASAAEFAQPRRAAPKSRAFVPKSLLPPQSPHSKVGSWLAKSVNSATVAQPKQRANETSVPKQDLPVKSETPLKGALPLKPGALSKGSLPAKPGALSKGSLPPKPGAPSKGSTTGGVAALQRTASDSGVQSGDSDSPALAAMLAAVHSVTIPAREASTKGRNVRGKAGPSGLQNISASSGDQSPGWSRVKRASREIRRNEQTLKALDVSGGDLCKSVVTPLKTRTLSSANNEAGKEVPERSVRTAVRRLSKKKSLAESSECDGDTNLSVLEKSTGLVVDLTASQDLVSDKAAQDRVKTLAEKAAHDKAAQDKAKAILEKVSQDKAQAGAEKATLDQAKADVENTAQNKGKVKALKKADQGKDKAPAREKAQADSDKGQEKLKAATSKTRRRRSSAVAGSVNATQETVTAGADLAVKEIAVAEEETSDNLKTNATQFKRPGRARKVQLNLDEILNCKVNVQVTDLKKLTTVTKEMNPAHKKPTRNVNELIAKHDSKKSIESVNKALNKLQDASDFESSEDEGFKSDFLLGLENQTVNLNANISYPLSEEGQDFAGFPSFNLSELETTHFPETDDVLRCAHSDVAVMQMDDDEPPQVIRNPLAAKKITPPAKLVTSRTKGPAFKKVPDSTVRKTTDDVVRSAHSDVAVMQMDDDEPPQVNQNPLAAKKITPPAKLVTSRTKGPAFKKVPDSTVRKTFSLDADTQDLASIAVNEDLFDRRIAEIAEANKSSREPSESTDNVLMNLTNSPIKIRSKVVASQNKIDIDAGTKHPGVPTGDASVDELIEQFRCYLTNKPVPNEFPGKDVSQTEFRKLRTFLVATKGPFETTSGEPLPGKRVLLELEPGSIPSLVTVQRQPSAPKACRCACSASEPVAACTDDGNLSDHSVDSNQSMFVNYTKPCDLTVKRGEIPENQQDQPPAVTNTTPKDKIILVNPPVMTQPFNTQRTQHSEYDTALESFVGNSLRSELRSPPPVSASLKAAIEAGDQAFSQTAKVTRNERMAMQGGGDSVQRSIQEATLIGLTSIVPESRAFSYKAASATDKTALGLAVKSWNTNVKARSSAEMTGSDSDCVPDTPNQPLTKKVVPSPRVPPNSLNLSANVTIPVQIGNKITIMKTITHNADHDASASAALMEGSSNANQRHNEPGVISNTSTIFGNGKQLESVQTGFGADDSDEDMVASPPPPTANMRTRALHPPATQSARVIRASSNVGPKLNETGDAPGKARNDPRSRCRKQSFVPRLTDPQATDTQTKDLCVVETLEASGRNRFKRIRTPSNSSEDEGGAPCGTVVISSDEDDDLPMRMSGDHEPNSMEELVNRHCRIRGDSQRKAVKAAIETMAAVTTNAMPSDAAKQRPSREDFDSALVDNDLTYMEEFPELNDDGANVCDLEDDSEDIVRPTPQTTFVKPKGSRGVPVRQPLVASPNPEESVYEAMPDNTSMPDEATVCAEAAHIVGSSLSKEDAKLLSQMVATVGATQDSEFTIETTHLVMPTCENGTAPRTAKFFAALASGAWVVSPTWVRKCVEAATLLQASRYEARDAIFGDSPRRSRLAGGGLFRDFAFFLVPPYTGPIDENLFTLILKLAGGAVVDEASDTANKKFLVALTELEDNPEQKSFNEAYMMERKSLLLAYTWAHTSVSAFGLRSIWKHLPKDIVVPPVVRSRYPALLFRPCSPSDDESDG